ncbi:MAG: DNA adenine methylase, partial [Chloroflexota bacterium]|nr:DNA adenine methylase [Chloroflexota bacterium]
LIDHLNSVTPVDGWFTAVYGGRDYQGSAVQPDGSKGLWQVHNTRKLDGIRAEIDRLKLDVVENAVALTSLILALDRVDNTMGHFVSYLRDWSPRSYDTMELTIPRLWINHQNHAVQREDIFSAIGDQFFDLAYYDPPYGSNNAKMPSSRVRYASYYHVWSTICLNDRPEVFGAARRRVDSSDRVAGSVFEEFRGNDNGKLIAVEAIRRLLKETNAQFIALSYSSNGVATAEQLDSVIKGSGRLLRTAKIDYQRNVMAGMKWTHEWLREVETNNTEFIFLIEKT